MSKRFSKLLLALVLAVACLPLAAQTYTYQTFSIPHQNFNSFSINNRGAVVGTYYSPADGKIYGFKRHANGVIERRIDDTHPNLGTFATAINSSGDIYGYSIDFFPRKHGFVRKSGRNGVLTTIDVPSAFATLILGANNHGDFVGLVDKTGTGGSTSFASIAGVITFPFISQPNGIAADGSIVGYLTDQNYGTVGVVIGPKGNSFQFEVRNSLRGNTYAFGINNVAGKIVGFYRDFLDNSHGFVYDYRADLATLDDTSRPITYRKVDVQTVDYPGAIDTVINGINSKGEIVGYAATTGPSFTFIGTRVP